MEFLRKIRTDQLFCKPVNSFNHWFHNSSKLEVFEVLKNFISKAFHIHSFTKSREQKNCFIIFKRNFSMWQLLTCNHSHKKNSFNNINIAKLKFTFFFISNLDFCKTLRNLCTFARMSISWYSESKHHDRKTSHTENKSHLSTLIVFSILKREIVEFESSRNENTDNNFFYEKCK